MENMCSHITFYDKRNNFIIQTYKKINEYENYPYIFNQTIMSKNYLLFIVIFYNRYHRKIIIRFNE